MEKNLIFLLLIAFVFLAGCTQLGGFGGQPTEIVRGQAVGVIIKSFRPDISEVFSGDSVTFTLTVENVGEEDANTEGVKAKLFGLGTDWGGDINVEKTIGTLTKSGAQLPGGSGDAQWDVTSPANLKVDNTYTAGVRVSYKYKSTALGNLKVISQDYIRTKPTEAEQIMKGSGLEGPLRTTKAPVEITLAGVARPFVYRTAGQQASVTIQIKNTGQGDTYIEKQGDRKITVEKITVNNENCIEQDFPQTVTLPIGSYKSISCKFNLPEVAEYTTVPLEVELSYNYFVDSKTTIKVLKTI